MRKSLYCIFDETSEIACNPFPASNEADAIRTFDFTIRNNPIMDSNRDSFVLRKVCDFDFSVCSVVVPDVNSGEVLLDSIDVLRASRLSKEGE